VNLAKGDITVCVPTIPPRRDHLLRAIQSVSTQTLPARTLSIAQDTEHLGAGVTRQRALDAVRTEWVAFLDDDDAFMPNHLEILYGAAMDTNADYVYSYYMVRDGANQDRPDVDPLGHLGRPFDVTDPHQTTVTTLVRTELAQAARFTAPEADEVGGQVYGEDFQFTVNCCQLGARVHHVPRRTWWWYHHGMGAPGVQGNTSGRGDRW
jgi:hypothetical protein